MDIPKEGTWIKITSVKYDGAFHRCWERNKVLYSNCNQVIGGNYHTNVTEPNGNRQQTKEPALFYFDCRYYFNVVVLLGTTGTYYYCNVCSPFIFQNGILQYIDFDLDLIVNQDGTFTLVDEDEYERNKRKYSYPSDIQRTIKEHLDILHAWVKAKKGPFHDTFISDWQHKLMTP